MKEKIDIIPLKKYVIGHCNICNEEKIIRYAMFINDILTMPTIGRKPDGYVCKDCAVREKL